MEFRVIIPARLNSQRLPGKMLLDIAGKPMLQHVYERCVASGAETVVVATDDTQIQHAAEKFGATVVMTSPNHQSGTERLSEAVIALEYDKNEIVVLVQGDLPMIPPEMIRLLAEDLEEHDNVKVTSLCDAIQNPQELFDPNVVKVVMNRRNYAMYFSRAPIPWDVSQFPNKDHANIDLNGHYFRHIGLYAFRAGFLKDYMEWAPSPMEQLESLEQLRIIWNGGRMHMRLVKTKLSPGVDTPADLEKVRAMIKK